MDGKERLVFSLLSNLREEELSKGVSCCNDDVDDEGNGLFGFVLASLSLAIILLFLPFSLCACLKVSIIVVIIFVLISPSS